MNEERKRRLAEIARIAVVLERETRFPAELLIAQWAIESRWGERPVGRNNYFGIKRAARHRVFTVVHTHEVISGERKLTSAEFADYESLEEACRDYVRLITRAAAYRAAWTRYVETGNVDALIDGIARIYATDPNYAALVRAIARQKNVVEAVRSARSELGRRVV